MVDDFFQAHGQGIEGLCRPGLAFDDDQGRFRSRLHEGFLHKILTGIARLDAVRRDAAVGQGQDPSLMDSA